MYQAFLGSADLEHSEFIEADLSCAVLRQARLSHSILTNCSLRGADLAHAILDFCDLTGANLKNANLHCASLNGTNLSLVRLTNATGLETTVGLPTSAKGAVIDRLTLERINTTSLGKLLAQSAEVTDVAYEYDVAISFAGEDREAANTLASAFSKLGMRVFYDDFERANLWGKNLYDHLSRVYKDEARFCVILVSKHYARKQWPTHERQAAQARAFEENREYILPIRLDDTEVQGVLPTTGFVRYQVDAVVDIARLLKEKLGGLNETRRV